MSTVKQDLEALPLHRQIILGSGALLLVASFLPWYKFSAGSFSSSASGWHQLGTIAWLFLIVALIAEGARVARVSPLQERQADLATTALGGGVLLFGVIFVIQRVSDGHLGIGFFLGLIGLIAFAYGVYLLFQASDGQGALKDLQAQAEARRRQDPPAGS
ncbi:MAG: hypothetical protein M0P31_16095 [Solirubrobacteraceae bacterium]|nr:hypothetical protein [Solirubrobacteraceae bacterium]